MFASAGGAADGVTAVGLPVVEGRPAGSRPERLRDARGDDHAAEREDAARDTLREGDQVGREAEALDAEPVAQPAEAPDHDVRDGEDAVAPAELLHPAEIAGRCHEDAARADHRLEHEGRDALGAEPLDRLLERAEIVPGDPLGLLDELFVALPEGHPQDARAEAVRAVVAVNPADQAPARRLAA